MKKDIEKTTASQENSDNSKETKKSNIEPVEAIAEKKSNTISDDVSQKAN